MLNPDLDAIRARYAGSELLWAYDAEKRAAGREIAARYEAAHDPHAARAAECHLRRFGFLPPPPWSVLQDYSHLLELIRERGLDRLEGDIVEIGAFLGGGVYQLARLVPHKRVVAVDLFEPSADETRATTGATMAGIYRHVLGGGDQRALYDAVVSGCPNVVTVAGDSATVDIPAERITFAHIDGNHDPAYVRSDFERLWPRVVSGGVLAFDDYGHDLPQVTATIDALRRERAGEIAAFWTAGQKTALFAKR
jgi:predicted O-methyltransferase YrrM